MILKDMLIGKKHLQSMFEKLHKVSIRGMNYGLGGLVESSGEEYVMKYLYKKLKMKTTPIIFDIGANTGQYTLSLIKIFSDKAIIYSFEPSLYTYNQLKETMSGKNQVNTYQLALGSTEKEDYLYFSHDGTTCASLHPDIYQKDLSEYKVEKITITTLDNFCKGSDIKSIDFLKLDVEGYELEVLKGAEHLLKTNLISYIQFEFGPSNVLSRTFLKDYFTLLSNYRIFRILQNGIREVTYNSRYEVFLTSNYLAINQSILA